MAHLYGTGDDIDYAELEKDNHPTYTPPQQWNVNTNVAPYSPTGLESVFGSTGGNTWLYLIIGAAVLLAVMPKGK